MTPCPYGFSVFTGSMGAAETYHLCIDSSVLGIEATVDFIEEFVKKKLKL